METETEKRCCGTCVFYQENGVGVKVCGDYDGLYFQWEMRSDERCPDYIKEKSFELLKK